MTFGDNLFNVRWESETRYYGCVLQQDLFGDWVIYQYWGGKASRRGGSLTRPVVSYEEALSKIKKIGACRSRRGYCLKNDNN